MTREWVDDSTEPPAADEIQCGACYTNVSDDYETETDDGCWTVVVCPDCNRIALKATFIGTMVGLEANDANPSADLQTLADSDETATAVVEQSTADSLDIDQHEAMDDENVRVVPDDTDLGGDDSPEQAGPDIDVGEHTPADPPDSFSELREVAPAVFEVFEPDEETEIVVNPTSPPPNREDWMAFPPSEKDDE